MNHFIKYNHWYECPFITIFCETFEKLSTMLSLHFLNWKILPHRIKWDVAFNFLNGDKNIVIALKIAVYVTGNCRSNCGIGECNLASYCHS